MHPTRPQQAKAGQRGVALLVTLVIVVMGISAALVGSLSTTALKNARQETTAAALAQAKEALIGKSVIYDDYPGSLPCPDTDNDGVSDAGGSSECPQYIGRLPWKTLGIADLRDGSGERLWYALSRNFRRYDSVRPLNSNTKGTLLVYNADGTSLQTQADYSAVAVIFSPGSPVGSQARNTVAQQNDAANYLDTVVFPGPITRNNASASGPFIAGATSDTFNDQLLFITTRNLAPLVEQRVAGAVKKALTDYYTANGYYPWADNLAWGSDNYRANDKENRGWLPNDASAGGAPDWGVAKPPQWFFDNEWYALIYYSVAKDHTEDPGDCDTCVDSTLRVDGVSGVRVLFFMPGTPVNPQSRISTSDLGNPGNYLEDAEGYYDPNENYENNDDRYVTPTSQAGDRDRLYWLPWSSIWKP